jgi:hypothetical protein
MGAVGVEVGAQDLAGRAAGRASALDDDADTCAVGVGDQAAGALRRRIGGRCADVAGRVMTDGAVMRCITLRVLMARASVDAQMAGARSPTTGRAAPAAVV